MVIRQGQQLRRKSEPLSAMERHQNIHGLGEELQAEWVCTYHPKNTEDSTNHNSKEYSHAIRSIR